MSIHYSTDDLFLYRLEGIRMYSIHQWLSCKLHNPYVNIYNINKIYTKIIKG